MSEDSKLSASEKLELSAAELEASTGLISQQELDRRKASIKKQEVEVLDNPTEGRMRR